MIVLVAPLVTLFGKRPFAFLLGGACIAAALAFRIWIWHGFLHQLSLLLFLAVAILDPGIPKGQFRRIQSKGGAEDDGGNRQKGDHLNLKGSKAETGQPSNLVSFPT